MPAATAAMTPAQQLNERFATIYTQFQPRITRLVRNEVRGGNHHLAEDLTADAFYRAWLDLHKCTATTDAQLYSWLATLARRTVTAHYRTKKNTAEQPADLGDWKYANQAMDQAGGCYTPAATGFRTAPSGSRRLVAVGTISRNGGRTTTVRATEAGVTGTITSRCPRCRRTLEACTCTGGAR
ncbi:RNA polymerase sigma factor [Streptomyces griseus]|uniref:RNA polymerase sigma factor n=1 Tax=Streptomyces griseus TaxID=1911 RepID=UPI00339E0FC5